MEKFSSYSNETCRMLLCRTDDPFWWSSQDLALLTGTRLGKAVQHYSQGLHKLHEWIQQLEVLYQQLHNGCPGLLTRALGGWGLRFEAVKWARSAVWSRAFTIKQVQGLGLEPQQGFMQHAAIDLNQHQSIQNVGHVLPTEPCDSHGTPQDSDSLNLTQVLGPVVAMVPVVDMCDHHPDQTVIWTTDQHGCGNFQVTLLTSIGQVGVWFVGMNMTFVRDLPDLSFYSLSGAHGG